MRTFIIAREVYNRGVGPLQLEVKLAKDLEALAIELFEGDWEAMVEDWVKYGNDGLPIPKAVDYLAQVNGDGRDFLLVKELVGGDTLIETPIGAGQYE